ADDPHLVIAPDASDKAAVVVSCRTEPFCDTADGSNTAETLVTVNCPPTADHAQFGQPIVLDELFGNVYLDWPVAKGVAGLRGCLVGGCSPTTLRGSGGFGGTLECLAADTEPITEFHDPSFAFAPGDGYYYLVRGRVDACGLPPGYTTNAPSE